MTDQRKDEMQDEIWVWKSVTGKINVHGIKSVMPKDRCTKYTRANLSPPMPDDVTVPRKVLQGVRDAKLEWQISSATGNPDIQYEKAKALLKALASLDAVLAEGE